MIEVEGLTKTYRATRAVDDLSFHVRPGIVTGFLGPNGAGKSTTMRMILGLDRPNSGTATINGVPYNKLSNPLHTVGALLDAKAVHPNRSARNHLRWIAHSAGIPASRVDEVLGLVGLEEVAKKRLGGFSLGMGQRLGLAQALLGDPEVLMLDEPVNGLDPEGILWVRNFLKTLASEGRTIFVSSHMLSEMALTADELVVIGRGKLIAQQSTYEFIKNSAHSSVVVRPREPEHLEPLASAFEDEQFSFTRGQDEEGRHTLVVNGSSGEDVGGLAFSVGIPLAELSTQRASLEEAFMASTSDSVQYQGEH